MKYVSHDWMKLGLNLLTASATEASNKAPSEDPTTKVMNEIIYF